MGGVSALAYEQTQKSAQKEHSLNMQNRAQLSLTGVTDVSGFDDGLILLATSLGPLAIRGEALHIDRIDLSVGQLEVRPRAGRLPAVRLRTGCGAWSVV